MLQKLPAPIFPPLGILREGLTRCAPDQNPRNSRQKPCVQFCCIDLANILQKEGGVVIAFERETALLVDIQSCRNLEPLELESM
jgi:hypothetical protein